MDETSEMTRGRRAKRSAGRYGEATLQAEVRRLAKALRPDRPTYRRELERAGDLDTAPQRNSSRISAGAMRAAARPSNDLTRGRPQEESPSQPFTRPVSSASGRRRRTS